MTKRIAKQILLAMAASLLCLDALAIAPGFYMGLSMGPASSDGATKPVQVLPLPTASAPIANTGLANPKSTQFTSRVFFGYKFNPYAGFEGGFTYVSGINYVLKNPYQTPAAGTTARVRGIDIVGKLDYSYNNTLGFFGKAGAAALYTTTPGGLNITNYTVIPQPTKANPSAVVVKTSGSNTYRSKVSPTFSIGATYDFTQNWQMEVS